MEMNKTPDDVTLPESPLLTAVIDLIIKKAKAMETFGLASGNTSEELAMSSAYVIYNNILASLHMEFKDKDKLSEAIEQGKALAIKMKELSNKEDAPYYIIALAVSLFQLDIVGYQLRSIIEDEKYRDQLAKAILTLNPKAAVLFDLSEEQIQNLKK